jgi:Cu2+-containing amine oxidase
MFTFYHICEKNSETIGGKGAPYDIQELNAEIEGIVVRGDVIQFQNENIKPNGRYEGANCIRPLIVGERSSPLRKEFSMTVFLKIKALARRKPLIDRVTFHINEVIATSNDLVEYIVRRGVDDYNKKAVDAPLFQYLTSDEIEDRTKTGKIGFKDRNNENIQDSGKAVENALACYNDGIFKVFINDDEVCFGEGINLKDGDEITFIRLTMLAGRLW